MKNNPHEWNITPVPVYGDDSYIYIIDNQQSEYIPNNCNRLLTFYNKEFIMKIGKVHKAKIAQTLIEIG